ncbi:MAG: methylated-DNA--[protein]-cysteine S-methyltransferase [Streptosporangiaceae bacterium]
MGPVSVGCTSAGVAHVRYGASAAARVQGGGGRPGDADPAPAAFADTARQELTEYFSGDRPVFGVAVDWTAMTGPQRQVLSVLAGSVSYGQTISYGALAHAAGLTDASPAADRRDDQPKPAAVLARGDHRPRPPAGLAARSVGTIMAENPIPVIVPCHRVVASDGLGGYSGGAGVEVKRWLLILEGSLPPTLDWQPMTRPD